LGFVGDWLLGSCTRGLVAGHYQPLADNPGIAPKPDQTRSLQSDQRTLEKTLQDPFECAPLEARKAGSL